MRDFVNKDYLDINNVLINRDMNFNNIFYKYKVDFFYIMCSN